MPRLASKRWKEHDEAEALLSLSRALTDDEIEQVLRDWNPAARHNVGEAGAFFTPMELACDAAFFAHLSEGGRYLDLCAGTGRLTWALYCLHKWDSPREKARTEYVCVEINHRFVEVGRRLMPWAEWECGSAFDAAVINSLGAFDIGVSNPPFGHVRTGRAEGRWLNYKGSADLQACEVLSRTCRLGGLVIMPQSSLPWDRRDRTQTSAAYVRWLAAGQRHVLERTSIDPSCYDFEGTGVAYDVAELVPVEERGAEAHDSALGPLFVRKGVPA